MPNDAMRQSANTLRWSITLSIANLLALTVGVTGCNNERKMHSRFPSKTVEKKQRMRSEGPRVTRRDVTRRYVARRDVSRRNVTRRRVKCSKRLHVAEYRIITGRAMTRTKAAFVERYMFTVGNTVLLVVPGMGRTRRNREGIKKLHVRRFDLATKKWLPQVVLQLANTPVHTPDVRYVSAHVVRGDLVVTWKEPSGAKSSLKAKSMSVATGKWTKATRAQVATATAAKAKNMVQPFGVRPRLDAKTGVAVVNHFGWISGSMNPKVYQKATLSRNGKYFATVRFPKPQGAYLGAFPATGTGLFIGRQAYLVDLSTGTICQPKAKIRNFNLTVSLHINLTHFPLAQGRWIVAVKRLMTKRVRSHCRRGAPCRSTPPPRLYGISLLVFTDIR